MKGITYLAIATVLALRPTVGGSMKKSALMEAIQTAGKRKYYFEIDLSPLERMEPGDEIVTVKLWTAKGKNLVCSIAAKLDYDDEKFAIVHYASCSKLYKGKGLGKLVYMALLDMLSNHFNVWLVADRETVRPTATRIYKHWLQDPEIEKIQLDINQKTHQLQWEGENIIEFEEVYDDPRNYFFKGQQPILGGLSFYKSTLSSNPSALTSVTEQDIQDFWKDPSAEKVFLASPLTKGYKLKENGYGKELVQLRKMYRSGKLFWHSVEKK